MLAQIILNEPRKSPEYAQIIQVIRDADNRWNTYGQTEVTEAHEFWELLNADVQATLKMLREDAEQLDATAPQAKSSLQDSIWRFYRRADHVREGFDGVYALSSAIGDLHLRLIGRGLIRGKA